MKLRNLLVPAAMLCTGTLFAQAPQLTSGNIDEVIKAMTLDAGTYQIQVAASSQDVKLSEAIQL